MLDEIKSIGEAFHEIAAGPRVRALVHGVGVELGFAEKQVRSEFPRRAHLREQCACRFRIERFAERVEPFGEHRRLDGIVAFWFDSERHRRVSS